MRVAMARTGTPNSEHTKSFVIQEADFGGSNDTKKRGSREIEPQKIPPIT